MEQKHSFLHYVNIFLMIFLIGITVGGVLLTIPYRIKKQNSDNAIEAVNIIAAETEDGESEASYYDRVLRFHVRANSDSEEDQAVKLKVKEAVLEAVKPYLTGLSSKEECKHALSEHLYDIMKVACNTLSENGFDYRVRVYFSKEQFPAKEYGDATFPAGMYEALRIDIGEAKGQNWWCMMYPALCFVDATYGVLPEESKEELKAVLPAEDYEEIFQQENEVELHFKLWDVVKEKLE